MQGHFYYIFIIMNILVAKNFQSSYLFSMEALERLEASVDSLIACVESLRQENGRLKTENAALAQDRKNLAEENQTLRQNLENELRLREEALSRVEALIQKVRDFDCAG